MGGTLAHVTSRGGTRPWAALLRRQGDAMLARCLTSVTVAVALAVALAAAGTAAQSKAPQAVPEAKQAKTEKPWPPDAETLAKRRLQAEALPLFASLEPMEITLTADFKAVQRDRDVNSKKTYPGTIAITAGGAAGQPIPIQLRTRGHVRRNARLCEFAPLRLEFPKDGVKGTVFEGQGAIKLGTHCQSEGVYRQYVLKEYLASRLLNVLTPRSLRVRLATVTYADAGKKPFTMPGIFYEDADDMAKRMEAREDAVQRLMFGALDQPALLFMSLFQYMIGNTDYSILTLHNVFILKDPRGVYYPVPYDFDYSGLVNAHYAVVAKELRLSSVQERKYRGPCKTEAELEQALQPFREKQAELLAMPSSLPGLDDGYRRNAEKYLNEFFETMAKPDRVKKTFVTECRSMPGM
jgi:hypothetical protein